MLRIIFNFDNSGDFEAEKFGQTLFFFLETRNADRPAL